MIPYAWFEKNGPVLYVNRHHWPFSVPLVVTASDRIVDNEKIVTPRQSGWMPYKRSADYAPVKGAVLDARVLFWIGQSPECFQFRVDTIKWIQDQLDDPTTAISNNTIGAIMTFAMWTVGLNFLLFAYLLTLVHIAITPDVHIRWPPSGKSVHKAENDISTF